MQELLTMALALLMAASGPNVPIELKNQAISVAVYAIHVSTQARIDQVAPIVGGLAQTSTSTKEAYQGSFSEPSGGYVSQKDGCFYARPAGSRGAGIKVSCPPAI